MKSAVSRLLAEFSTTGADKGWVVRQLEETGLSEAAKFLIQIATAESEEDYVRIEALEALRFWVYEEPDLRSEVAVGVLDVAMRSEDALVKTYAMMALGPFIDCFGVLDYVSQVVLDPNQNEDLRYNALEALRKNIRSPRVLEVIGRVAALADSVGRTAQSYCSDREDAN